MSDRICIYCGFLEGEIHDSYGCENFDDEENLIEENKRLKLFASGRGMVSEADNMSEVAVLVCGLHDKIERLERELRDAKSI